MSAIFGILQLNHALDIKLELNNMKKIIGHYGTDEQEIYVDGAMGFGCCLRKLTTYSQEDTPIYMDSNQERILVGDAVIYNREELIRSCQLEEDSVITTQRLLMETYLLWGALCKTHQWRFYIRNMGERKTEFNSLSRSFGCPADLLLL